MSHLQFLRGCFIIHCLGPGFWGFFQIQGLCMWPWCLRQKKIICRFMWVFWTHGDTFWVATILKNVKCKIYAPTAFYLKMWRMCFNKYNVTFLEKKKIRTYTRCKKKKVIFWAELKLKRYLLKAQGFHPAALWNMDPFMDRCRQRRPEWSHSLCALDHIMMHFTDPQKQRTGGDAFLSLGIKRRASLSAW